MLDRSGDGVLGLSDLKACIKETSLSHENPEALGRHQHLLLFRRCQCVCCYCCFWDSRTCRSLLCRRCLWMHADVQLHAILRAGDIDGDGRVTLQVSA